MLCYNFLCIFEVVELAVMVGGHILCHQGMRGWGKPKYDKFVIIIIVSHLSDLSKRGGVITYDNMVNSRGGKPTHQK
jgi:hypothetical protein